MKNRGANDLQAKLMLNTSKNWTNRLAAKILWVHFLQGNLESGLLLLWILVTPSTPQHLFEIWSRQLLFWLWLRWLKHRTNRLLYISFPPAMKIFINSPASQTWPLLSAQSPQHYRGIWPFTDSGGQARGDHVKNVSTLCFLTFQEKQGKHHHQQNPASVQFIIQMCKIPS